MRRDEVPMVKGSKVKGFRQGGDEGGADGDDGNGL